MSDVFHGFGFSWYIYSVCVLQDFDTMYACIVIVYICLTNRRKVHMYSYHCGNGIDTDDMSMCTIHFVERRMHSNQNICRDSRSNKKLSPSPGVSAGLVSKLAKRPMSKALDGVKQDRATKKSPRCPGGSCGLGIAAAGSSSLGFWFRAKLVVQTTRPFQI